MATRRVIVNELAAALDVLPGRLASALQVSTAELEERPTRLLIQARARQMLDVFEALSARLGSPELARQWLREPVPQFDGASALDILLHRNDRGFVTAMVYIRTFLETLTTDAGAD
jgi:hypothetical protein